MKNEPAAKAEKKLTSHEFWMLVKQIAELKIRQVQVSRLMGLNQGADFCGSEGNGGFINYEMLSVLEKIKPGSVVVDGDSKTITLIGWDLEQFDNTDNDHSQSQNIHKNAKDMGLSEITTRLSDNPAKIIEMESGLQGVINPLTDAPQGTSERNQRCCCRRVCRKGSRPIDQEHKETTCNEDFVPVIKRKFGDRVFHMLSRLMFWNK